MSFAGGFGSGLPKSCQSALQIAGQSQLAVVRANSSWSVLTTAATANSIDPSLLGAIGIRETGFQDVNEKGGKGIGVGVFQLTVTPTSGVTAAQANDLAWAANYAAAMLQSNVTYLANKFPKFTPAQLLQATAASYNLGPYGISGNPNTIDVGSAPGGLAGNYGSNVVQLMTCF